MEKNFICRQEHQFILCRLFLTGLFNIHELCWDQDALAIAGINQNKLSNPVNPNYSRKDLVIDTAQSLGITKEITFVIGASDGCLANLGSLAVLPNIAGLTIGTSGAVRIASKKALPNFEAMSFNYLLDDKTFICGGPINNGGAALQWLLKDFLKREITNENYLLLFKEMNEIPVGCEGLVFLPYLQGERAPIWDAKSCGTFFGVKSIHTQAHFSRATLEGICFSLNEVLTLIEHVSENITQINVSGGFTASKTWIQMLADVTGKKICLIQTEDASAVGAAYLAMKSLNLIQDYSEIKPDFPEIINPDLENHLVYQKHFSIYKELYKNLKSAMHKLYLLNN